MLLKLMVPFRMYEEGIALRKRWRLDLWGPTHIYTYHLPVHYRYEMSI
jgi:hypothetical protein